MMDINNYSEEYVKNYDSAFGFEKLLIEGRRRIIIETIEKYSHKLILELGCGLEPLFPYIREFDKYIIIDPVKEFLQNARHLADQDNRLHFIHGFFGDSDTNEKMPEKKFDFIIASSLLHEVKTPKGLLKAIHSKSNSDTIIHFNVSNVYSFHRLLAYEAGLIKDIFKESDTEKRFQRHTHYDMSTFISTIKDSGFEIISNGTYLIKPFTNDQIDEMVRKKIISIDIIKGLEKMIKYIPNMGCEMYANVKIS